MTDTAGSAVPPRSGLSARLRRLAASPAFQARLARLPLLRRRVRREGEAMMDLLSGFIHSQILSALLETGILADLVEAPATARQVSARASMPEEGARRLLQAATALGLLRRRGDTYVATLRGAALTGVPGLREMVLHHGALYRDLADPVAFFRGEGPGELARVWPYVFSPDVAPEDARRYSYLMAGSQALVAAEVLDAVPMSGVTRLMDVGGGTGAFLSAALARHPHLAGVLLDLPAVVADAAPRFRAAGQEARVEIMGRDMRAGPLPGGADAISLVRVLYDHADDTVAALLARAFAALPPGGRLIVAEPMSGGTRPTRAGDAYFAIYTAAMGTGRTRSAAEISAHLAAAGFEAIRERTTARPFVTQAITARRPD